MKNNSDKDLGMQRNISRRDFLNGVSVAVGSALFSNSPSSWANHPHDARVHYPPSLTGMRGSHRGSFEVAHALREGYRWDASSTGEKYDLVVVGAGISGLSAAHYYRESAGNNARMILVGMQNAMSLKSMAVNLLGTVGPRVSRGPVATPRLPLI